MGEDGKKLGTNPGRIMMGSREELHWGTGENYDGEDYYGEDYDGKNSKRNSKL